MSDLRPTIVPKSDQINADDLIGQTMTIKITSVTVRMDEQPVSIHFDGDNGKPWKPGKSMRRVLVNVWGHDSNNYIGRSLTLYRDDKVQFGGLAVGGIRISHMSDIPKEVTMALTMSRANKKPFVVRPLIASKPPEQQKPRRTWSDVLDSLEMELTDASDADGVAEILGRPDVQKAKSTATGASKDRLQGMIDAAIERTTQAEVDAVFDAAEDPEPDPPATDALMIKTLEMVQQISARNKETLPALTVSGKYTRFVDDLEKSGRLDLMNRIRDANSAAMLREVAE